MLVRAQDGGSLEQQRGGGTANDARVVLDLVERRGSLWALREQLIATWPKALQNQRALDVVLRTVEHRLHARFGRDRHAAEGVAGNDGLNRAHQRLIGGAELVGDTASQKRLLFVGQRHGLEPRRDRLEHRVFRDGSRAQLGKPSGRWPHLRLPSGLQFDIVGFAIRGKSRRQHLVEVGGGPTGDRLQQLGRWLECLHRERVWQHPFEDGQAILHDVHFDFARAGNALQEFQHHGEVTWAAKEEVISYDRLAESASPCKYCHISH